VLESWLGRQSFSQAARTRLTNVFLQLNFKVAAELGEHFQIGHSYFMQQGIERPEKLEQVWRHAVLPLLEEYFHARRDAPQFLEGFRLERLLSSSSAIVADE
jgi:hypothetical protein